MAEIGLEIVSTRRISSIFQHELKFGQWAVVGGAAARLPPGACSPFSTFRFGYKSIVPGVIGCILTGRPNEYVTRMSPEFSRQTEYLMALFTVEIVSVFLPILLPILSSPL